MNNAQHASMELLANMAKPDVAEAERALELSRSLGLPPRVTGEIEEYIETARRAGGLAKEAKTAQDRATKCWQAVKEQAGRCDDLVDMANSASASRPVAAPSTDDTTEAESESSGPLSGDLAADMAKRFPAVVDFFAIPRSDAATQKYLVSLPVTTNDDYQPSLVRLGRAAAQSEDGSPGNPYHGADPDNAIAHAYELGVTSVISPESMPPVSKDDDSNDEEDDTDE